MITDRRPKIYEVRDILETHPQQPTPPPRPRLRPPRPRCDRHPRLRPETDPVRLIVEDIHVTGWHVQIRLRIPLDNNPANPPQPPNPSPDPDPDDPDDPLSTQDRLRSLGKHQRAQLPTQRPRVTPPEQQHRGMISPPGPTRQVVLQPTHEPVRRHELVIELQHRRLSTEETTHRVGNVLDIRRRQPYVERKT